MNVKQLLDAIDWPMFWSKLTSFYDGQEDGEEWYRRAVDEMRSLSPNPEYASEHRAIVCEMNADGDEHFVHMREVGEESNFGIEFMDWCDTIALPIDEQTLARFSIDELACHIVFEMTFNGYSNKAVAEERLKLEDIISRVESHDDDMIELSSDKIAEWLNNLRDDNK